MGAEHIARSTDEGRMSTSALPHCHLKDGASCLGQQHPSKERIQYKHASLRGRGLGPRGAGHVKFPPDRAA